MDRTSFEVTVGDKTQLNFRSLRLQLAAFKTTTAITYRSEIKSLSNSQSNDDDDDNNNNNNNFLFPRI